LYATRNTQVATLPMRPSLLTTWQTAYLLVQKMLHALVQYSILRHVSASFSLLSMGLRLPTTIT
jgi:hypothetical protein